MKSQDAGNFFESGNLKQLAKAPIEAIFSLRSHRIENGPDFR
jgi:hypothetical protein